MEAVLGAIGLRGEVPFRLKSGNPARFSRKRNFSFKGDHSVQIASEVLWVARSSRGSPRGTPALTMGILVDTLYSQIVVIIVIM